MKYCLIIGNPLKRPRSVPLWNKFFRAKKMKLKMFEKVIPKNLFKQQIMSILEDPNFKASAVTMPYKKKVLPYVINELNSDIDGFEDLKYISLMAK